MKDWKKRTRKREKHKKEEVHKLQGEKWKGQEEVHKPKGEKLIIN